MKKWDTVGKLKTQSASWRTNLKPEDIVETLLKNRGLTTKEDVEEFLHPPNPAALTAQAVGIDKEQLAKAIKRMSKAIKDKDSVVVYADYDADGITAGAIMWETLYKLGAKVMPYIPHRVEEGYGLSVKGIDTVKEQFNPKLIITVDHGVTASEKVAYAKRKGIEVIVTDHHVKPKALPECLMVHTTKLSGAGISWFVAKELSRALKGRSDPELVALAAIGTIADIIPLVGPNRALAKSGLDVLNETGRVGLNALITDAGLVKGELGTYDISHIIAPRLNAMGRIEHALDALRLLCTGQKDKARELAQKLGLTNRDRQQLTVETTTHALGLLPKALKKLIFVSHKDYNQGVIGLVAGRLVEEYYRPAVVVAVGEIYSKASARSVAGFNIVEAIRRSSDILVDVGGHPMAAGFTVETRYLATLQNRLEQFAEKELNEEMLTRKLRVDLEIPLSAVTTDLWQKLRAFEPFGFGNPEPVFMTQGVTLRDVRLVGAEGKHLKLRVGHKGELEAIAFNLGKLYGQLSPGESLDLAYTIDVDTWNGNKKLQLKIKDIHPA